MVSVRPSEGAEDIHSVKVEVIRWTFISSVHLFFFFNDTATTEIYTLSLHDALPIYVPDAGVDRRGITVAVRASCAPAAASGPDRKSTRLNSSHTVISYAVFCLKKNNNQTMDEVDLE